MPLLAFLGSPLMETSVLTTEDALLDASVEGAVRKALAPPPPGPRPQSTPPVPLSLRERGHAGPRTRRRDRRARNRVSFVP